MCSLGVTLALGAKEIRETQHLRRSVYLEEEMEQAACSVIDQEYERADADERSLHLVVRAACGPVATVRLTLSRENSGGESSLGLDLESKFELHGVHARGLRLAEVSRFCVLRRYRGTRVTTALFNALVIESRRRNVTHWLAGGNTQTDSPEDAALIYRIGALRKLRSESYRASARSSPVLPRRPTRLVYSALQHQQALAGEHHALALPPVLALFTRKMGARFLGPPAYDAAFGVFAMPLIAALEEVAVRQS